MSLAECAVDPNNEAQTFAMLFQEKEKSYWLAVIARRATSAHAARRGPEDIFQEACLKAHEYWDAFPSSGMTFKNWFYRIVRDCVLDDHDRNKAGKRAVRLEEAYPERSSMQLLKGIVSPGTNPGSALAREEMQQRIQHLLELLKPEDREILCMRFFDQLSYDEAGQILGIPAGTARKRCHMARMRFGELWLKHYGEEGRAV